MITPAAAPAIAAPASVREAGTSRAEGFDEAMASALGLIAPATNPAPGVTSASDAGEHPGAIPVPGTKTATMAVSVTPSADSAGPTVGVEAATSPRKVPSPAIGADAASSTTQADPRAVTPAPMDDARTTHVGVVTAPVPRDEASTAHLPSEGTITLPTAGDPNATNSAPPADRMATANLSPRQNVVESNETPGQFEPPISPIPDEPIRTTEGGAGHQIARQSTPPAERSEDPAAPETSTSPLTTTAPPLRRVEADDWFLRTPPRDSTTDGALEPVGQRPPDLQPIAEGAETAPRVATALLQRVEEVVRRLENAPPPRSITVTIDDQGLTRITVSVMADGVRLTVPEGSNTPATLVTDLEQALSNRGFEMSRDRDRKSHEDQLADANPHPAPNQPPPAARLRTDSGVRL